MAKKQNKLLLSANNITIESPTGRVLFRDLNLAIGNDKVAIIGRNGVGKSSLFDVLGGLCEPKAGLVHLHCQPFMVYQELQKNRREFENGFSRRLLRENLSWDDAPLYRMTQEMAGIGLGISLGIGLGRDLANRMADLTSASLADIDIGDLSDGELRKWLLVQAKLIQPELLLLDEPSEDLDKTGLNWLSQLMASWPNGLLVISHEEQVLQHFQHFFVVSETGCRYFNGSFTALQQWQEQQESLQQKRYQQELNQWFHDEKHQLILAQRRRQKKNQGRWRELGRMTPKTRLNKKRSYAQESQGRVAAMSRAQLALSRTEIKSQRRKLAVDLPFPQSDTGPPILANRSLKTHALEKQPPASMGMVNKDSPTIAMSHIELKQVSLSLTTGVGRTKSINTKPRMLFREINLSLGLAGPERLGITGPNGVGKSTLLKIILKRVEPDSGKVISDLTRIGSIAQGGADWCLPESLIGYLLRELHPMDLSEIVSLLARHRFPYALAERPLKSLSPGERVRAAFICLLAKGAEVQWLILDEPTFSLDFLGYQALTRGLKNWPRGLIVVSHDQTFLKKIGTERYFKFVDENKG